MGGDSRSRGVVIPVVVSVPSKDEGEGVKPKAAAKELDEEDTNVEPDPTRAFWVEFEEGV